MNLYFGSATNNSEINDKNYDNAANNSGSNFTGDGM